MVAQDKVAMLYKHVVIYSRIAIILTVFAANLFTLNSVRPGIYGNRGRNWIIEDLRHFPCNMQYFTGAETISHNGTVLTGVTYVIFCHVDVFGCSQPYPSCAMNYIPKYILQCRVISDLKSSHFYPSLHRHFSLLKRIGYRSIRLRSLRYINFQQWRARNFFLVPGRRFFAEKCECVES